MKGELASSELFSPSNGHSSAGPHRRPHVFPNEQNKDEEFDRLLRLAASRLARTDASRPTALASFASDFVHEIRNPLAGISGALDVFRGSPAFAGANDRMLSLAQDEIRRIERTLQGFLGFVSPEPLRLTLAELNTTARGAADSAAFLTRERSIQLRFSSSGSVPCVLHDPRVVQGALLALITNSVEELDVGGNIHIELTTRDSSATLCVSDDGPGVAPAIRTRIFRPFFSTRKTSVGLGLVLARQAAEAHGGSLELLDSSRSGARFMLSLPLPLNGDHRSHSE
jgi:two-component system sensor histidine kinase HydH